MTLNTLQEALDTIEAGWSAQRDVTKRAVAMREALEAGHDVQAQAMADEIAILQDAEASDPIYPPSTAEPTECWALDLATWANVLVGGGFRRGRDFHMPIGATVDEARARACSTFAAVDWCEPAPLATMKRTFAGMAA